LVCGAYCALAGFSIATQRALCMLACFVLAGLLGRRSSPANNLLLAALLVLVLNPFAALGSGFWLSFAAVAALLWLGAWQHSPWRWQRLLWTHGFMSLVMLPLGAWWFGGSSVVSALANLLMIPLVGMVVVPLALLAVVAMFALPAVEPFLWELAAWPLLKLLPLAQQLAAQADGWLYRQIPPSPPEVALALAGVVLVVLPLSWRVRSPALLLLLPLALPPQYPARFPRVEESPQLTRVTVLDVGQGTAVIVRAGGQTLLYDTGGGDPTGANMASAVILPYLRLLGVSALDTLVISHPDNDHSAGTTTIRAAMPVKHFYYGGKLAAASSGRSCFAGQAWRWPGGQRFQFLSPAAEVSGSSNDSSCVLLIEAGGRRLLLAGDVENARERELVRYWGDGLASDWLLVAHHGSRTSSSYALLKQVRPDIAVLSSGYANRFGHPHPDVVARLREAGAVLYGTASDGALEFEFAPDQPVRVRSWRREVRRFWM
jgi:competence protein ComEC